MQKDDHVYGCPSPLLAPKPDPVPFTLLHGASDGVVSLLNDSLVMGYSHKGTVQILQR